MLVWIKNKFIRKILAGALLNVPYLKSCTLENANLGFRTSGIRPFDPSIIPEHNYINDFQDVLDADFALTDSQINWSTNNWKVKSKAEPIDTNLKSRYLYICDKWWTKKIFLMRLH